MDHHHHAAEAVARMASRFEEGSDALPGLAKAYKAIKASGEKPLAYLIKCGAISKADLTAAAKSGKSKKGKKGKPKKDEEEIVHDEIQLDIDEEGEGED